MRPTTGLTYLALRQVTRTRWVSTPAVGIGIQISHPLARGGTGHTNPDMPEPNAPLGCLLWKPVGAHSDHGWWTAQSETIGTSVNASGDYHFRINDHLDDNSGCPILYVSIYDYPAGT